MRTTRLACGVVLGIALAGWGRAGDAPDAGAADALQRLFAKRDAAKAQQLAARVKVDPAAVSVADLAKRFEGDDRWRAIFAFVRDKVRTEAYRGRLRGAQGTLLSLAGNPADKASLLVALLREAGLPARFAVAEAPEALRRQIIAGMFDPKAQVLPAVAASLPVAAPKDLAAPERDPKLLAELATHVWAQVQVGDDWLDLDPTLSSHAPGKAPLKAAETPDELAEGQDHAITVRVLLRVAKPDGAQEVQPVLERTLAVRDLAGKPALLAHEALPEDKGGGVRPILFAGAEPTQGQPFTPAGRGAPGTVPRGFRDVFKQADDEPGKAPQTKLLAEWLEITSSAPGLPDQTIRRCLLDGKVDAAALAAASRRAVGLVVLPGAVTQASLRQSTYMASAAYRNQAAEIAKVQKLLADGQAEDAVGQYREQVVPALLTSLPWLLQGMGEAVAAQADLAQARMNRDTCTRTYCHRARVHLVTLDAAAGQARLDLGLHRQRTLAAPGRPKALGQAAQLLAPMAALAAEGQFAQAITGAKPQGAHMVMEKARAQKLGLLTIRPKEAARIAQLPVAATTRELMKGQLTRGCHLIAMPRPLEGAGALNYAWYAFDPADGHLMACLPDGSDGVPIEYEALNIAFGAAYATWPVSVFLAFDSFLYSYAANMIAMCDGEAVFKEMHVEALKSAWDFQNNLWKNAVFGGTDPVLQWIVGSVLATAWLEHAMKHQL